MQISEINLSFAFANLSELSILQNCYPSFQVKIGPSEKGGKGKDNDTLFNLFIYLFDSSMYTWSLVTGSFFFSCCSTRRNSSKNGKVNLQCPKVSTFLCISSDLQKQQAVSIKYCSSAFLNFSAQQPEHGWSMGRSRCPIMPVKQKRQD